MPALAGAPFNERLKALALRRLNFTDHLHDEPAKDGAKLLDLSLLKSFFASRS